MGVHVSGIRIMMVAVHFCGNCSFGSQIVVHRYSHSHSVTTRE